MIIPFIDSIKGNEPTKVFLFISNKRVRNEAACRLTSTEKCVRLTSHLP